MTDSRDRISPIRAQARRDDDRLDSWKEIASYLRRSGRTARRWEVREGLPVRRHHHQERGSVYAYRSEIDTWRRGREAKRTAERGTRPTEDRSSNRGIHLVSDPSREVASRRGPSPTS